MIIYHNPRCSKSRQTLSLLNEHGIEPEVIEYLKQPLSKQKLKQICKMLDIKPEELVRMKESLVKELKLKETCKSQDDWLNAMIENPKLIERPIVVNGSNAIIGRPPENVLSLLP